MEIGNKIRTLRGLKNLSQEKMAEKLGISSTSYAKIERNETDLSYSRME
ncbi:MAG: transcriptional regulator with XRE-family HTH domain [Arenicella sp.]|jgi:transcriptional regulator with XRE-family HTH domain